MGLLNIKTKPNISFEIIAEEFLIFKKHSLKESTYFRYEYIVSKYLIPYFGGIKLNELKKYKFNNYTEKLYETLSSATVLNITTILKSILKYCERKYDCDFKLDLISKFRKCENEIETLANSEFVKLEKYCLKNPTLKNIGILICMYTGIRLGELCALKWEDIDLHKKEISINKTMQRIYMKGEKSFISINSPKTQTSNRTIPISKKLLSLLVDLKKENKFIKTNYLLTGSSEKYIEPRGMQYHFETIQNNCELRKLRFHSLRHTFASRCIQIGMDVKSLSEILGHTSVDITLNRYVHSSFDRKMKLLDKL